MKKFILILFLSLIVPSSVLASGATAVNVTAPTSLVGTIVRQPSLTVVLNWHGMKGANYIVKKISPDGSIDKFSLMSNMTDPNCEIAGGIFRDSAVTKEATYTYEVRSFIIPGRLSAPAVITIIIIGTDVVGCKGTGSISYQPTLKNLALYIEINRGVDDTWYDVYVDGKHRDRVKTASTIWPVVGSEHAVEVKLADRSPDGLVSTAKACDGQEVTSKFAPEKDYSDNIIGRASEYIDNLIDNMRSGLQQ